VPGAIDSAIAFIEERLNGEDGLGAIFPPMANHRDDVRGARQACRLSAARRHTKGLDRLLVIGEHEAYWPALRVAGVGHDAGLPCLDRGRWRQALPAAKQGLTGCCRNRCWDTKGDWA